MSARSTLALLGAAIGLVGACSGGESERLGELELREVSAPSTAPCSIIVTGTGTLDIETEYLAKVIACEASGEAGLETLKAQAIAARSVAYYSALGSGSICDGQGCQVYSCNRQPGPLHYQAVQATAYQYLSHSGLVTYGFYVAGSHPSDTTTCIGGSGASTEHYVTYNQGKSGASVEMTTLGYIPKGGGVFGQNRGCMSQNGAVCLENAGSNYADILRFYYGSDIEIRSADGAACGGSAQTPPPPPPVQNPPTSGTLQPMTRDEIIGLAASGVGYSYWYGGEQWDPSDVTYPGTCHGVCTEASCHSATKGGPEYGADCSGFVQQVWQAPFPYPLNQAIPHTRYTTASFRFEETDWFRLASREELKRGDALVYREGNGGHIVLFDSWAGNGQALVYECAGCDIGCVHRVRSVGPAYIPIRRRLVDDASQHAPEGELEMVECTELSGWAYDADTPEATLEVFFTIDRPLELGGERVLEINADQPRDDKCLGSECSHGFIVAPPSNLSDGLIHRVYAYVVDPSGGEPIRLEGSPSIYQCGPPPIGTCAHSPCEAGAALDKNCNVCATAICRGDPHCCTTAWDDLCVQQLATLPGSFCAGLCAGGPSSCGHDECAEGAALDPGCSSCAEAVCTRDPFCCTHNWDWICAREAKENAYCACN